MPQIIDWHSHHTPPELVEKISLLSGRSLRIDSHDSSDFSQRIRDMDESGVDLQLVSQGAGINADALIPDQAIEFVRQSNDLIAERLAPFSNRLIGATAITLKHVDGSVEEIQRMARHGFRVVMMYSSVEGEVVVDRIETDPILAKIAELELPIFLHGGGGRKDPTLKNLEDNGRGVSASALADANVSECVVRMIASGVFDRYP